ncbi:(2Fe-2S)-binding protein [Roseomonas nepalensis]|uniref:(2Fe-2S)-binding protein n=1 Tax=Muricoccus nepalensis TaxID=1854500 RepID=A0A502GBE3_9PROT|nr:(2Fe-2S)-binding protein [Roseomonas nepalensis]TPG59164.1 (2Fe-2S)-binding protein [Roseomonas nepalensis]
MAKLTVNGRGVEVDVDPATPLIYVLRNDLALNGPKLGCGRAQCGACTVHLDGEAIRSCQFPVGEAEGRRVTTLEGLGTPERPHPLQEAFLAEQAAQCGYCTSGMIMQGAALIQARPGITEAEVLAGMEGNLCRCGTQPRVVRAVLSAARKGA